MEVLAKGVCSSSTSGKFAPSPQLGNLGRGDHQVNGEWGATVPATRTPVGAALLVPRGPRDRVGLGSIARQHARHQFQRYVHRIARPFVGRRWLHGASRAGTPPENGLFRKAHRAGPRHGSLGNSPRRTAREALPGSPRLLVQHASLASFYNMVAPEAAHAARLLGVAWLTAASAPESG